MGILSKLKDVWSVFKNRDPTIEYRDIGMSSSVRSDRLYGYQYGIKNLQTSIYTKIAMDVSYVNIHHVKLDEMGRFKEIINSPLDECLNLSANIDQTGRYLIQDAVETMLYNGSVALVPVLTNGDIFNTESYDIYNMRVGKILEWYPMHVKVSVYNEDDGKRYDVVVPKNSTCIVENPFYSIMNEPNSTISRLNRKLSLLDAFDEEQSQGKLNLIIQLPFNTRTNLMEQRAQERLESIEKQLVGSRYGIGYIDSSEKVTQLNRSLENNLPEQIKYLTDTFYSQLGITEDILNGRADETMMLNYYTRVIEPIISAFTNEMKRKFLTKTARTQRQSIEFFRDPFKLVTVDKIASISDTMKRNEILSTNELRQIIGFKPSDDEKDNQLVNPNISQPKETETVNENIKTVDLNNKEENQNGDKINGNNI